VAILVRCPNCKTDQSLRSKVCKRCGKRLTTWPSKVYKVVVKHRGKTVTQHVHSWLLAKELEVKIKNELVEGTYFDRRQNIPTLDEVWEKYSEEAKVTRKSWDRDEDRYRCYFRDPLGGKSLDAITPMDIQKIVVDLRKSGKAPKTIRNALELIGRLFNFAKRMGLYPGDNPVEKVTKPKVTSQVERFLQPEEIRRLWTVCKNYHDPQAGNLVLFALLTGLRRSEIFKLKWEDIDLEGGWLILRNPKGGRDQKIPLNQLAIDLLKDHPRVEGSPYVFPGKGGRQRKDFKGPWRAIKELAGIPKDFRFHDLRHTYASYLASSGELPLQLIQRLLTHQSPQMTQRYAHLAEESLRRGARVMDKIIAEILGGQKEAEETFKQSVRPRGPRG